MTATNHVRGALRSLARSPAYAAAFAVTLGLAIGVNSAVFSVVRGVLLKPLPYDDADRILYVQQPAVRAGVSNATFSFMEIDDYRDAVDAVDEFVEFGDWNFSVVGGDSEPHRAVAGLVTSNYFEVLGLRPLHGRVLTPEDDREGAEPVIVLTHEYWTRVHGADPAILGSIVELTGKRARIVGVLEPGNHYTGSRRQDFFGNYTTNDHYQSASMRDARTHRMTDVFARLRPGAGTETARLQIEAAAERLHGEYPDAYPERLGFEVTVTPWAEELSREARPTFLVLMGTVIAVLLLACANVANLTLTRLIRREGELATRGALGASAADLRNHLLAENLVLAVLGAGLGLGLAVVSRDGLVAYASRFTVRAQEVGVDWVVFAATLAGGVAVAVLLAWMPGLPVAPGTQGVASAASKATGGRMRKQVQRALVVGQLALSFALLAGAGLLVRSLLNLYAVDPGFDTENVLTMEAPAGNFLGGGATPELFREVLHRTKSFPGVRTAAVANWAPLTGQNAVAWNVRVEGGEEGERTSTLAFNAVTPEYLDAVGLRLVAGRFIEHGDRADTDSVVVLSQGLARAYFGDEDPVGRRISFSFSGRNWLPWWRVVGVVADAREYGIREDDVGTVYRAAEQGAWGPAIIVATQGEPEALARHVKQVVHELDPTRPVDRIHTLEDLREEDVAPSRLNATLFGAFAVLALLIAGVGVLGVLAFSVSQRVREFGIRMALGADRRLVLRTVLAEGLLLVTLALVLGGLAAVALGRLLSGLLFGVDPVDPPTLAAAAGVLGAVALGAAFLPARRATRVDPNVALRAE